MWNSWKAMNLPNKLTCIRVLLVPLYLLLYYAPFAAGRYLALVVFILASLTDYADGYLARRDHLITDFGKFMDPLADKLLVGAALIAFVDKGELAGWICILLIAREFIISGFRLVAANRGIVIAAGWSGKVKTVVQMVLIIVLLLRIPALRPLEMILLAAAVVLTIVSCAEYIWKNKSVITTGENHGTTD